ncbi:dentin sialophosphoprotein-like isoform X1 [Chrysemys picta bellii]|uniref:dentin sialophosphoprotein-like isoform X1 n=2 Tax=Chrysemys picta bellii TaxID=8478 RepID=UPI0032B17072
MHKEHKCYNISRFFFRSSLENIPKKCYFLLDPLPHCSNKEVVPSMNTLLLFMSVLGISFASPIKRSVNLLGSGYAENVANVNAINANKEILSNGSGNAGRNQQNGENENDGHPEGAKFSNYTRGPNQTGEVSAIDINYPQRAYEDKSNNQPAPEDPDNTQGTQNIDQNAELRTGKGINHPHLDLHVNTNRTSEENPSEHLPEKNSIYGSAWAEEGFAPEDAELSTDKQDVIEAHSDSSFNVGGKDEDMDNGHHHSDNGYFNDEGMQRVDPGNAGDSADSNSSQQEESNSDSAQSTPKHCKSIPSESKSSSKAAHQNTSVSNDSISPSAASAFSDPSASSGSSNPSASSDSSDPSASSDSSDPSATSDSNNSSESSSSSNSSESSSSSNSSESNETRQ